MNLSFVKKNAEDIVVQKKSYEENELKLPQELTDEISDQENICKFSLMGRFTPEDRSS